MCISVSYAPAPLCPQQRPPDRRGRHESKRQGRKRAPSASPASTQQYSSNVPGTAQQPSQQHPSGSPSNSPGHSPSNSPTSNNQHNDPSNSTTQVAAPAKPQQQPRQRYPRRQPQQPSSTISNSPAAPCPPARAPEVWVGELQCSRILQPLLLQLPLGQPLPHVVAVYQRPVQRKALLAGRGGRGRGRSFVRRAGGGGELRGGRGTGGLGPSVRGELLAATRQANPRRLFGRCSAAHAGPVPALRQRPAEPPSCPCLHLSLPLSPAGPAPMAAESSLV